MIIFERHPNQMDKSENLYRSMREVTRLTQVGRLQAATEAIQRALGARSSGNDIRGTDEAVRMPLDGTLTVVDTETPDDAPPAASFRLRTNAYSRAPFDSLDQTLEKPAPWLGVTRPDASALVPGAQFLEGSYANQAGTRAYKLYVPSRCQERTLRLVVMLHGCTQSPDDFAAGTQMNALAEERAYLVLYPAQARTANTQKCWNWFKVSDQQRDVGEPSVIAGLTREIMSAFDVDPRHVYVAGLSAGGAMAAVMGTAYPDLYAAVGVHSGLAYGAARDLPSALAAMKGNSSARACAIQPGVASIDLAARSTRTIVFHGDQDTIVHPRNGDHVILRGTHGYHAASGTKPRLIRHSGQVPGGHSYTRDVYHDANGHPFQEHWTIHGAGHAWSGGCAHASYTDPKGPDAAKEMLRFFEAEHPPAP